MFIRKMMQSDWLDSGTWTIYTFPYRRSGPFIRFLIKVKTQDFWEDDRETIDRGREKLVTFGKLSVNFRKHSGRTRNDRLLHFKQNFPSIYIQHKFCRASSEYFSQAINSLIISLSYRPPCGRFIRQEPRALYFAV